MGFTLKVVGSIIPAEASVGRGFCGGEKSSGGEGSSASMHTHDRQSCTYFQYKNNNNKNKSGILHTTGIPGDCRPFQYCSHVSDCSMPAILWTDVHNESVTDCNNLGKCQ